MIKGIHGLFYSSKPEEARAFLRDKLQLPFCDVGGGWLIFDFPEGDLGVHPTDGDAALSGHHDISFFTDDLAGTVAELKGRGVTFEREIEDHGYGLVTFLTLPGGVRVQLYQPKYRKSRAAAGAKRPRAGQGKAKRRAGGKRPARKPRRGR
jgi:hypothetical protein